MHAAAAEGFEDFWDLARGLYVDHIVLARGGRRSRSWRTRLRSSPDSPPGQRWATIADTMTDPDRVVVRSRIGAADGGYDPQKMAAQVTGDLAVDLDVDREVVSAEPFGSYLVHDAVASRDAPRNWSTSRRWETFLIDGYDTFGECWTWGTPVHGWSASPTRDLVPMFSALHRSSPASPEPGSRRDPDRSVRSPGRCQPPTA